MTTNLIAKMVLIGPKLVRAAVAAAVILSAPIMAPQAASARGIGGFVTSVGKDVAKQIVYEQVAPYAREAVKGAKKAAKDAYKGLSCKGSGSSGTAHSSAQHC